MPYEAKKECHIVVANNVKPERQGKGLQVYSIPDMKEICDVWSILGECLSKSSLSNVVSATRNKLFMQSYEKSSFSNVLLST